VRSSSIVRSAVPFATVLVMIGAVGAQCFNRKVATPDVPVNPAFEMAPPIAKQVAIQMLEDGPKGRVRVEADFGRGVIRGQYHAIELTQGKVVMRDDGKDGDTAADDGKFSVVLDEDVAALTGALEEATSNVGALQARGAVRFVGREQVPLERAAIVAFDVTAFRKGKLIPLPSSFWCKFLLDASIPHSLMVVDVAVVEDPSRTSNPCAPGASATKAWTFGKLMTDMANTAASGVTAETFVKNWLSSWLVDTTINSDTVAARSAMFTQVIQPWVVKSGSPAGTFTISSWTTKPLNLDLAPFKLTAIINRLDLRGNSGYGFANPGEGRFIFEVLNPNTCVPFSPAFTVIFEYGIPIHQCGALKAYARHWYDLKTLTIGSAAYNAALQAITDVFAKANADPSRPNGSALNQIRTNEIVLGFPWELREFNIDATSHNLFETTVKQEPAKKYNAKASPPGAAADVSLMASWVNANATDVMADQHAVPLILTTGEPFLGGKAHTEPGGLWDAAPLEIVQDDARQHFSLNTCSGCHGGETATGFLHVGRAPFGSAAPLSGFLTGVTVIDPAGRPAGSPKSRSFADLDRRKASLEALLCTECGPKVFELGAVLNFKPVHMVH
jgi:hypothetical protein